MATAQSARLRGGPKPKAAHEWYQEPRECVEWLLDHEELQGVVYDPACGGGVIVDACRERGIVAHGSDIIDRANGRYGVVDFLSAVGDGPQILRYDHIVSNPPFSLLMPFVDNGLKIARHKVIVLARLAWLEGAARQRWFTSRPLARVLVLSKRISMPPAGQGIKATGGAVAFAWFVFDPAHCCKTHVEWIPHV
jgi:hypothetical protein